MLDNDKCNPKNERFLTVIRNRAVEYALNKGYDVIVSDTNLKPATFYEMVKIAERIGNVRIFERRFDVDLKECLERNKKRERKVPEEVIKEMYKRYKYFKPNDPRDVYVANGSIEPVPYDKNKENCIIVDIDGTVALNIGRSYYDLTKVSEDKPNSPIINLVQTIAPLGSGITVNFVSGRDDICYQQTKDWIVDNIGKEVYSFNLYMRKTGDNRRDVTIKKEIYDSKIKPFYNVEYAIDDRPAICRLWKSIGIPVLQLNDMEF